MTRILLVAVFTTALVALMSGCAFGDPQKPDVLLTRSPVSDEGEMAGLVGGTLEMTRDGRCVLLSGKPVVWPAETTLATDPLEIHFPSGLEARAGDVITGGGGEVPAATIQDTLLRIEGDLSTALKCAPADSQVVVFTERGDALRVVPRLGYARASFENGFGACRRAHVSGRLARLVEHAHGDAVAAQRLVDRLRHIVLANLRLGNNPSLALQGCLEAVWPDDVPLPRR